MDENRFPFLIPRFAIAPNNPNIAPEAPAEGVKSASCIEPMKGRYLSKKSEAIFPAKPERMKINKNFFLPKLISTAFPRKYSASMLKVK